MKLTFIQSFIKLCLISAIIINIQVLYAQKRDSAIGAKLTFNISDPSLKKHNVIIKIVQDYILSQIGAREITTRNDNGLFKFYIPEVSTVAKFNINYQTVRESFLIEGYIESGDNIFIQYNGADINKIRKEDFKFYGKGSQNLIVKSELESAIPNNISLGKAVHFNMDYLDEKMAIADSSYNFYKRILNKYKYALSDNVFKIMDADIYGRANTSSLNFLSNFYILFPKADPKFKDSILLYLPKLERKEFGGYSPFALQSRDYLTYQISKARGTSFLRYGNTNIQNQYAEITRQTTGLTREKVLINFLMRSQPDQSGDKVEFVFSDALKYVKNPVYKNMIIGLAERKKLGAKAFPFYLPDSTGKMYSLKDFKGKTLIIDCWFTGCTICSEVAKSIDKYVLPKYIDNKNVVFLSVNADRSKELWKKSIKTGLYTNLKSINLFTEGLAQNHPFMKNYQFQGFPRLMLVDKNGNILSSSLTRDPKKMIEIIDEALKIN